MPATGSGVSDFDTYCQVTWLLAQENLLSLREPEPLFFKVTAVVLLFKADTPTL